MSRHAALKQLQGHQLVDALTARGILVRCRLSRDAAGSPARARITVKG